MAYSAKIILDSVSEVGDRLTTMEITFPRYMLPEFNTHRSFSRNSASSRAIPVKKQIRKLLDDPFIPEKFGRNESGMQSSQFLEGRQHDEARETWLRGRDRAATSAFELLLGEKLCGEVFGYRPYESFASYGMLGTGFDEAILLTEGKADDEQLATVDLLNVHKQFANRLLEPFMWQTVIVTATEWRNFFALRANPDAQPEIRTIAERMKVLYEASTPQLVGVGDWHLPFIQPEEAEWARKNPKDAGKVSSGRSARVSYLTHDGRRDLGADIGLYERLVTGGHMSPLEHVATPAGFEKQMDSIGQEYVSAKTAISPRPFFGNFHGWKQLRKFVPDEDDFSKVRKG
ncbi:FAD-dependent thymidylate synthase [Candidatus Saccharibacteria bacterium]|nr:FAD-dependent thymidylate synthase [Candidatus Saccharibacteria bacterium]